jgi:hypothetical protein
MISSHLVLPFPFAFAFFLFCLLIWSGKTQFVLSLHFSLYNRKSYNVTFCQITPSHNTSCQNIACLIVSHCIKPCQIISGHIISNHARSYQVTFCHVTSCRIIFRLVKSCHVTSRHIKSYYEYYCHVMSCHTMSCGHVTSSDADLVFVVVDPPVVPPFCF